MNNDHLQPYALNPCPQVRRFWYQIVLSGHVCSISWCQWHWMNFSQSLGCGQYPPVDRAGHEQATG
jgi:hypothetical protein